MSLPVPNFGPTMPLVLLVTRYLPGQVITAGRCEQHAADLRRIAAENRDGTWEVLSDDRRTDGR